MASLAEVEAAITGAPPASGLLVLDERLRLVAERPPLPEGALLLIAIRPELDVEASCRPGDGREGLQHLRGRARAGPEPGEVSSGPTRAPVEATDRTPRADARPEPSGTSTRPRVRVV